MATAEQLRERTALQRKLNRFGIAVTLIDNPSKREQWYRRDGMPLPNLLPIDDHHRRLYTARGWSLFPPENPVMVEARPVGVSNKMPKRPQAEVETAVRAHTHRFTSNRVGAHCTVAGCSAQRKRKKG